MAIAITALANAEAAFEWRLAYAKERRAFGPPIASFQHNQFVLATIRTELDVAQVFVDPLVHAVVDHELTAEDAAGAKG